MSLDSISAVPVSQGARQPDISGSTGAPADSSPPASPQESLVQATSAASEQATERQEEDRQAKREQLEDMARNMQSFVQSFNKSVRFSVDEASGRDVISVVDQDSGELLRQIPSEELLKLAVRLGEASGVLIAEEV